MPYASAAGKSRKKGVACVQVGDARVDWCGMTVIYRALCPDVLAPELRPRGDELPHEPNTLRVIDDRQLDAT